MIENNKINLYWKELIINKDEVIVINGNEYKLNFMFWKKR